MSLATRFTRIILCSTVSLLLTQATHAQGITRPWQATPAEGVGGITLFSILAEHEKLGVPNGERVNPLSHSQIEDSAQALARNWVVSLRSSPVTGIRLDPMGALSARAGHDTLAQRQFMERLATPGLSTSDRAYTLVLAVQAFGRDADDTARMRIAEAYNAQLQALPASVFSQKFDGRISLAFSYSQAGDGAGVIEHLTKGFMLVPRMSFEERRRVFVDYDDLPVVLLANVWSGLPEGRRKIDSLGRWLQSYAVATPEQIGTNPLYQNVTRDYTRKLTQVLQLVRFLGTTAPEITGHFWINASAPGTKHPSFAGASVKKLNDGVVRIIEYGHRSCLPCMRGIPILENLQKTHPGLEVWFEDHEDDSWGANRCLPAEKARHLTREYTQKLKFDIPIALWIGPRSANIDGGTRQQASPSTIAYDVEGSPMFVVTDGQGRVRFIYEGYSYGVERVLRGTVRYLLAEAARTPRPAS
jgi:thiol-disulfide isomerase/thioredoxin